RDFLDSIDSLLESGCFDPAVRNDVLSEFASQQFDGSGYGVPIAMPNLVPLREGQIVVDAPTASSVEAGQTGNGQAISGPGGASGGYASGQEIGKPATHHASGGARATRSQGRRVVENVPVGATDSTAGPGQTNPGSYHHGDGSVPAGEALDVGPSPSAWQNANGLSSSGSGTFMEMVEASVQRSLLE